MPALSLVDEVEHGAEALVRSGLKPLDALHLAFASWAKVDYFCTCDDRLLKQGKRLKTLACSIVSPMQLIAEVAP
jgi:predicted nucleic acid-binding protein